MDRSVDSRVEEGLQRVGNDIAEDPGLLIKVAA